MTEWFKDGEPATSLPLDDRSMSYGDGVFETIAIRDGEPRLWTLHKERLVAGCRRLGLELPPVKTIEQALFGALERTTLDPRSLTAKLVVSAGPGPRGYRRPDRPSIGLYVSLSKAASLDRAAYETGVAVRVCRTPVAVQPQLAGIKSLNRLDQVLARQEWRSAPPWEGLMLDVDGHLICGTMSNVFLVNHNAYATPRLDRSGVAGVMRRHVIDLLEGASMACPERRLTLADLSDADEVFLTNSQVGAVPVTAIDDRPRVRGPATERVMQLLAENGVPECAP